MHPINPSATEHHGIVAGTPRLSSTPTIEQVLMNQAPWTGEGYKIDWFCYPGTNTMEHAAELDRRTLERLVALPVTCSSAPAMKRSNSKVLRHN